ncbi:RHS repeat-associated core domain-containing protein [Pseudomonas wadenswilerensis]
MHSQQRLASLSGRTVLEQSQDAGWQLALQGDAGQTVDTWDTRGNHWQTDYDDLLRPLQVRENAMRIAERFTWSGTSDLNQRGRLVRQDDEAGSRMIDGYDLTGQLRGETRHFLATPDLPDWPDAVLEPGDGASTTFVHGPLQELLTQTDALGNRQSFQFNLSGELMRLVLQLEDGTEHPLLTDARYNAFGQIESQTAGNGVVSHCTYEPATGRLSRLTASRPGRSTLQDLLYDHDPVGNVVKIEDLSQPVSHFANQRVDPVNTFHYDSLYQLIEATGREAAGATIGPGLPDLAPDPGDTSRLLNYRQFYDYDASGNLLSLRHVGQQPYTREMAVAEDSNRAVPAPGNPLTAFDANGNLLNLGPGQPLQWNARNQLHGTRQVVREDGEHDEEHYRYSGDGLRLRKVVTRRVAGRMQTGETRYLPGLELHTRPGESYAVITTQAGRCAMRCLYWSEGQPEGIANPQLRYSLDDLHGSSALELDEQGRIISHEGYYPFGGTAWWAARSALEAGYKTHRYSGKERDSTGLYDYGLRYYAPWLMRWINPDPAGDVDGLNRYTMVHNNPSSLTDRDGLMTLDPMDLATLPHDQAMRVKVAAASLSTHPLLAAKRLAFSQETQQILDTARENSQFLDGLSIPERQRHLKDNPDFLSLNRLNSLSAHAAITSADGTSYQSGFVNFPASLSPRKQFPGVLFLSKTLDPKLSQYLPDKKAAMPTHYLISNTNALLNKVGTTYAEHGTALHPMVRDRIRRHIEQSDFKLPLKSGIPGLHAEIQAMNWLLNGVVGDNLEQHLSRSFVFTERLSKSQGHGAGEDFPACFNCDGILPALLNVITGRSTADTAPALRARSDPPRKSLRRP